MYGGLSPEDHLRQSCLDSSALEIHGRHEPGKQNRMLPPVTVDVWILPFVTPVTGLPEPKTEKKRHAVQPPDCNVC